MIQVILFNVRLVKQVVLCLVCSSVLLLNAQRITWTRHAPLRGYSRGERYYTSYATATIRLFFFFSKEHCTNVKLLVHLLGNTF